MYADSFDRWLYLRLHRLGRMGRSEWDVISRVVKPGMTIVDVGSNIGLYTVLLARLVGPTGKIHAFEPDPRLFSMLERNCAANGTLNVQLHHLALGRKGALMQLHTLILNSGDNHLAPAGSRIFRDCVEVEVAALDEALPDLQADIVKIDVQGWELEVLHGMTGFLGKNPGALIFFEYWPGGIIRAGYTPSTVTDFFTSRGYRLLLAETGEELEPAALVQLTSRLTGLKHADLIASR